MSDEISNFTQGPDWLVELITSPPDWLFALSVALFVLFVAALGYRLHSRGWRVTLEQQYHMQIITGVIITTLSATMAMAYWSPTPYAVDVVVGFIVGYGLVMLLQSRFVREYMKDAEPDPIKRRNTVWVSLVTAAVVVPMAIAYPHYQSAYVFSRGVIVALGMAMFVQNQKALNQQDTGTLSSAD